MSLPQHPAPAAPRDGARLIRWAIWVAIGALIAAAIVCVVWVLIGPDNGIVGRAFLTILLLASFAGVAILDAHLAQNRPPWFALTSMVVWVVTLLLGAFLIWMPTRDLYGFDGFGRFLSFLLIVLVLQLAVLHVRLYVKAHLRHVSGFTRALTIITVALVGILAILLVIPLGFHEYLNLSDLYWRFVVAVSILAAVGTALVPLINALFAPKRPRPQAPVAQNYALPPWPTYADGVTPLPVLPDGSPDWNAYYTGFPSHPQPQAAPTYPAQQAPAAPHPASAAPSYPAPGAAPSYPAPGQTAPPAAPYPAAPPATGYQGYPPPPPPPQ